MSRTLHASMEGQATPVGETTEDSKASGPVKFASAVVRGTASVAASQAAPLRGLRQLVSGSKLRFQREGFDLDLTYVLPRLIALGLPATNALEQIYRNPISEVYKCDRR